MLFNSNIIKIFPGLDSLVLHVIMAIPPTDISTVFLLIGDMHGRVLP